MELNFTKMHGTGNDFIFIDDLSEDIDLTAKQVRCLCDRHLGIGADGVILIRPSKNADCIAYMHYINENGMLAEMCGNGIRCFAKYLVDKGFVVASDGRFVADTLAGKRPINFKVDETDRLIEATVDMGKPAFAPDLIPTKLKATSSVAHTTQPEDELVEEPAVIESALDTPLGQMRFTCVNMGNPHAVTFLEGVTGLDLYYAGPTLVEHEVFPEQANIGFAEVLSRGTEEKPAEIQLRVYERGVGETLACGTGTCAAVVAAVVTGRIDTQKAIVYLPGGTLLVEWLKNNHIKMTGPAKTVYEGTIEL